MEKLISKLVNKFVKESFVDITNDDTDEALDKVTEGKFGDGRDEIDVAEPKGKITGADFKKLKQMKKSQKQEVEENIFKKMFGKKEKSDDTSEKDSEERTNLYDAGYDYDAIQGWHMPPPGKHRFDKKNKDNEDAEVDEGNAFTGALAKAKKAGEKEFEFDGKTYPIKKESVNRKIERILERRKTKLEEKHDDSVEDKRGGSYIGKPLEKLQMDLAAMNSKIEKFKKENEGEDVPSKMKEKLNQIKFAIRNSRKPKKESVKENTIRFTESEMIDFIERIVEAEVKEKNTVKSLSMSKKVNDDATKEVVKKMKDYMKNMGTEYVPESESFPKGNKIMSRQGKDNKEITDDVKKAYKASDQIEEYIENFTAAGLENLDYDNIKPNEDWVTDNIEGSSRTGNSQEYANAVKTDVNKKVNERRKKNLLAVLKRQAYNKSPQPTHSDEAGEIVPSSLSGKKNSEVNKIMAAESVENKKVISEMEKMKKLINYNQKTQ